MLDDCLLLEDLSWFPVAAVERTDGFRSPTWRKITRAYYRLFGFSSKVDLAGNEMGCCCFRFSSPSVLRSDLPKQMDRYYPPSPDLFSIAIVDEEDQDG
ncbi:hypothetical protein ACLOJK_027221 [Asimina triloba]